MQLTVSKTNDHVSPSHHFAKYDDSRFRCEESEESGGLNVLMGGDIVSAVEALNVIKNKLYDDFAQAGVCDPEDLVGETLLKLWEIHHGSQTLGKGIIETTAQEVYRRSLRERCRRAEVQIEFLPEIASPPLVFEGNDGPRSFLERVLDVAINSLAELDWEIVRSHVLNKTSFEELAALSALSKNGIKIRHYRAIDKLRLAFLKALSTRYRDPA